MILDEEVFAVILAITIVASVVGIAQVLRPEVVESFTAIGLLNSECKIGNYPDVAVNGTQLDLCLFIANYMGRPIYYKVTYKLGGKDLLPTNSTPSPMEPVTNWFGVLGNRDNVTIPIRVPIVVYTQIPRDIALIFELWLYDTGLGNWTYSGRWVHLYINVTSPLPGVVR